jgi:hypothetical protein
LNLLDRSANLLLLIGLGVIAEFTAKCHGTTIPKVHKLSV